MDPITEKNKNLNFFRKVVAVKYKKRTESSRRFDINTKMQPITPLLAVGKVVNAGFNIVCFDSVAWVVIVVDGSQYQVGKKVVFFNLTSVCVSVMLVSARLFSVGVIRPRSYLPRY